MSESSATRATEVPPFQSILLAIIAARARRQTVVPLLWNHGVQKVGALWWPDPEIEAVDPIGASILAYQPKEVDRVEAAAAALGQPPAYVHGFAAGVSHREPDPGMTAPDKPTRQTYIDGLQDGVRIRMGLLGPGAV